MKKPLHIVDANKMVQPAQPVQGPVDNDFFKVLARNNPSPDQRPWVGLTEDELLHIGVATGLERAAAQMIEAKLKEKNT